MKFSKSTVNSFYFTLNISALVYNKSDLNKYMLMDIQDANWQSPCFMMSKNFKKH